MSRTFGFTHFLQHISPIYLESYCQKKQIPFTLQQHESAEQIIERFIAIYEKLPADTKAGIDVDFQDINDLTTNAHCQSFITEATARGIPLPDGDIKIMTTYDIAFWFYLNQYQIFSEAFVWDKVDTTGGWKEMNIPSDFPDLSTQEMEQKKDTLAQYIRSYLRSTALKADKCGALVYEKEDCICFVVYPEDYAHADTGYAPDGVQIVKHIRKPLMEIYFVYYPREKRLKVKAKGTSELKAQYQKLFIKAIFDQDIEIAYDRIFDLNKLKQRDFNFASKPERYVEFVRVKSVQVKALSGMKRLTLDSLNEMAWGMSDIHQMMNDHNIQPDAYNISQAIIYIKFKPPTHIKRSKESVTVRLTWPNSHDLKDQPLARIARTLLQEWGIDTKNTHENSS